MKSIVRLNAEEDQSYRPYCMRCPGLVRMRKAAPFLWYCPCGAVHDERRADDGNDPSPWPRPPGMKGC